MENNRYTGITAVNFRNKQYKKVPDNWRYIKRYTNAEKGLAPKARFILSTALHQIDKYGEATLTHEELSLITETKPDQNCILVKQLGFVLHSEFFRSKTIEGKKYRDGYTFTPTKNASKILENPIEFFTNYHHESIDRSGNEIGDMTAYNRGSQEPLLIYNKNKYKNDYNDNLNNQSQNSSYLKKEIDLVKTENHQNENPVLNEQCDFTEDSHILEIEDDDGIHVEGLAEKVFIVEDLPKLKTIEFVDTTDNLQINQMVRPTEIGLDGKTYWTIFLRDFKYSESLLKEIILKCNQNRQHYSTGKVVSIMQNILEKYPNKQIRGGRSGFKKYMIAAINGENDYTEKGAMNEGEKLISIAEKNAIEALEVQKLYESGEVQYF